MMPKLLAVAAATLMVTSAFAMTDAQYTAEKERIQTQYKAAKAQCNTLSANAKDICEEEAEGQEKVAKAELKFRQDPSEKNRYEVAKEKAVAAYDVAKEKCDDLKGNVEDVCEKEAKAEHVKALETAKVSNTRQTVDGSAAAQAAGVAEVRKDAAENVREAQYKAAKERCDAMSGDAKDKCIDDAKRTYAQ